MSAHVENRSRFAVEDFLLWDGQGCDVLVVCVAGRFDLPPAGCSTTEPLRVSDVQMPPPAADVYWGEPERSSLRVEGQRVYTRPGTDVYVSGHAWAPGGWAPLWPEDFDERFFQAAAPGLNAAEGLRGGEAVVLAGMHADGRREFLLPRVGLEVETHLRRRVETRALVLDAVHLEVDEGAVTLLWRAAIRMHRELAEYEGSVVREVAA